MLAYMLAAQLISSGTLTASEVSDSLPIRQQRTIFVGGHLGWNDYGGAGISAGYNFHPHFATRVGAGFGLGGLRAGVQGRVNFLKSGFTPFVGAGFLYGFGVRNITVEVGHESSEGHVRAGPYAQALGGFEYLSRGGFTVGLTLGYSFALFRNTEISSGDDTASQRQFMSTVFSPGGIVAGLNMGATF